MLRTLLSLWIWFEMFFVSMILCTLLALLTPLLLPFDPQRRCLGRLYRLIAVLIAQLAPMWRVTFVGSMPRHSPGRAVVICNHLSHLDSFFLASLPWEMKWLGKASIFRVPFIGWGMHLAGDVPVVRGNRASAAAAMARCAAYLRQDMPVFIFPEGTRSTSDTMLPFKDGAFRLAIETGAQVLPVAIAGTRQGLPKHAWRFNWTRAALTVGSPISTAGLTLDVVAGLRDQARAAIEALRDRLAAAPS